MGLQQAARSQYIERSFGAANIPQGLSLAPVPALADFAFARHHDAQCTSAAGAGTPEYTAPEVGRGHNGIK